MAQRVGSSRGERSGRCHALHRQFPARAAVRKRLQHRRQSSGKLLTARAASDNGAGPADQPSSSSNSSSNSSSSDGDADPKIEGPSTSSASTSKHGNNTAPPWKPADDSTEGLIPFLQRVSATYSKSEPHYLQLKDRSNWWKRGTFPRTPHDRLDDPKIQKQPVKLWKKVVPLAIIFFLSTFNLTILQALKDAIVVTTSGAEALPFLASFVVLPASVVFFAYYSKMLSIMPKHRVYYLAVAPFVVFYGVFATAIYPIADTLHFHGLFEKVAPMIPRGLHGAIKVVENWTFSLFFCSAELWGSVVIAVLFWTLANDVCTVDEAKTVYPMMGIAANVALVAAGNYMKFVSATVLKGATTQVFLQTMVTTIVGTSIAMALTKLYVDRRVLKTREVAAAEAAANGGVKKKKPKGNWKDTLQTLRESPKIMNLALLVVCYALAHRLFEFAWKGQLRVLFPTTQAYSGALADVSIYTGYMTIALMLTGKFVFEYLGWGTAALATPVIMFFSGIAFFGLSLAAMYLGVDASAALLTGGAIAGALTQVFARASKFSLFDPAKEMVYIEMTKEEKSKGKAAVDLMGSQAGKSGASWIIQGALLVLGSAVACLPVLSVIYVVVLVTWARAAVSLKTLMAATEVTRQESSLDVVDGESAGGAVAATPVAAPSGAPAQ